MQAMITQAIAEQRARDMQAGAAVARAARRARRAAGARRAAVHVYRRPAARASSGTNRPASTVPVPDARS
jgi:hypothetical protein